MSSPIWYYPPLSTINHYRPLLSTAVRQCSMSTPGHQTSTDFHRRPIPVHHCPLECALPLSQLAPTVYFCYHCPPLSITVLSTTVTRGHYCALYHCDNWPPLSTIGATVHHCSHTLYHCHNWPPLSTVASTVHHCPLKYPLPLSTIAATVHLCSHTLYHCHNWPPLSTIASTVHYCPLKYHLPLSTIASTVHHCPLNYSLPLSTIASTVHCALYHCHNWPPLSILAATVYHCPLLPTNWQPLSTIASSPVSTIVHYCPQLSTIVHHCLPMYSSFPLSILSYAYRGEAGAGEHDCGEHLLEPAHQQRHQRPTH
jgi:hypothetical protein